MNGVIKKKIGRQEEQFTDDINDDIIMTETNKELTRIKKTNKSISEQVLC